MMVLAETRPRQPTATREINIRFPGQYYDQESGLHYNYHRFYHAATGRYTRSDPIGTSGGLNTYVYASGNPIGRIDPRGLVDFIYYIRMGIFKGSPRSATKNFFAIVHSGAGSEKERFPHNKEVAVNDPEYIHEPFIGPTPTGIWEIQKHETHPELKEFAFELKPIEVDTERDGFYIHGYKGAEKCREDIRSCKHSGSEGCIIMDRPDREKLAPLVERGHNILKITE